MRLAIVILLLACSQLRAQQVPLLSQYMYNPVALNPAATGSEEAFSIVGTMRAQWIGFPGAPTTQSLTAHAPLKRMKSAVGIQIFADQIGINRNTGLFFTYAYRMKLNSSTTLSMGLSGGLNMIKSYYSKLDTYDPSDAALVNDSPLGFLPDFSTGLHLYGDQYFVSFSLPMFLSHVNEGTRWKLDNNFRNYNLMLGGGYRFDLDNGMYLKPSILIKYKADARIQLDLNTMMRFHPAFEFGLSYRTEEALLGLFKFDINNQLSLMYSFGIPLSEIWRHSFGSHELSLRYNFMYRTPIESPRFMAW